MAFFICHCRAAIRRSRFATFEYGMIWAYLIAFLNNLEPGFGKATFHIRRMVHLTVAVSDARKVKRSLLQAEGGGFIGLTVPEQLKDVQIGFGFH